MSQLRQRQAELDRLGIRVNVVTFDNDLLAAAYARQTKLPWPLLFDPDLGLYAAYGLRRASWWEMFRPTSLWKFLTLFFQGHGPGKPGKDWRQLGGDVLIDPDGIVRIYHASLGPHDRLEPDKIFSAVEQSGG